MSTYSFKYILNFIFILPNFKCMNDRKIHRYDEKQLPGKTVGKLFFGYQFMSHTVPHPVHTARHRVKRGVVGIGILRLRTARELILQKA